MTDATDIARIAEGRAQERAAIVAWIRSYSQNIERQGGRTALLREVTFGIARFLRTAADQIEACAHLAGGVR